MNKIRDCPFCDGIMERKQRFGSEELVCMRCGLGIFPPSGMTMDEFERRFNRRAGEKKNFATNVDVFMKDSSAIAMMRIVSDYQPCSRQEILSRCPWLSEYLDVSISEAVDLDLVKASDSEGTRLYSLTRLGKDILKEVTA